MEVIPKALQETLDARSWLKDHLPVGLSFDGSTFALRKRAYDQILLLHELTPVGDMNRRINVAVGLAVIVISTLALDIRSAHVEPASSAAPVLKYVEQGWLAADRDAFYTTSQGSLMMPYTWFRALRRVDVDEPFAGDQLQRYGYLPNAKSASNPEGLPVGFVITGNTISGEVGMTCAACHTGQLEYEKEGVTYALRLDGAPTNADFQSFLSDLTEAARATLADPSRFDTFARAVLRGGYSNSKAAQLKIDFAAWVKQFGDFMDASLPPSRWGPGRLDAFGMIFNRVAGLDLRLPHNIKVADAPVSYPFLWNASRQDRTQWNGGVPNGLYIQALGRNTGEVLGVFAKFSPQRIGPHIPGILPVILYRNNSAYFAGLQALEEKIVKLRPPPWPKDIFGLDEELARKGEALFATHCKSCHSSDQQSNEVLGAWATQVKAVGTDSKMAQNAERLVDTGILEGSTVPLGTIGDTLDRSAKAHDVLAVSVIGILLNQAIVEIERLQRSGLWLALRKDLEELAPDQRIDIRRIEQVRDLIQAKLSGLFRPSTAASAGAAYESRALHGIWATAPYLHNGSVPNLWELLTPARERKKTFMVGSRVFDPKNVGYMTDRSPFQNSTFVADPENANGNGNGGHEYGTGLTAEERWALIEYLKVH
jgi:processive rubber oxygenase RoxA-like protein